MGPANVVFDRLQLHSWCIPNSWSNSLPLELMFVLLGLSIWDLNTFTHNLSGLNFVWMMRINRSHFLSAFSIANAARWRDAHVNVRLQRSTFSRPRPLHIVGPQDVHWLYRELYYEISEGLFIDFILVNFFVCFQLIHITTRHFMTNIYYREIALWLACTVRDLHH